MSEVLATSPQLPEEASTVAGRLADIIATAEVRVDDYRLSESDRETVVRALRNASGEQWHCAACGTITGDGDCDCVLYGNPANRKLSIHR